MQAERGWRRIGFSRRGTGLLVGGEPLEERRLLDAAPIAQDDSYHLAEDGSLNASRLALGPDFVESFDSNSLGGHLEGTGFVVDDGALRRSGPQFPNDRQYVRTIDSDLLDRDFTFEATLTTSFDQGISSSSGPARSMIVGFGRGQFDQGLGDHEPGDSLFLRFNTPSTKGGALELATMPLTTLATFGNVSAAGVHRVRIEKIGSSLTFSVDAFYDGSFRADYSYTVTDLAETAPFLSADSRLFFGTGHADDTFDDVSLVMAPARGVLVNDQEPDGQPLSARLIAGPSHGELTLSSDGSFSYTPAANYFGDDQFTYVASDGQLDSANATVRLRVEPRPDPTTAVDDAYEVDEDGELSLDPAARSVKFADLTGVRDLVYDAVGGRFWASIPNAGVPTAGAVVPIDPQTGAVGAAIIVGNEPNQLAVSDDGLFLYVGLDGTRQIRRVNLQTGKAAEVASLQDVWASDIEVVPGHSDQVAVALADYRYSPRISGIMLFQNMALLWRQGQLAAGGIGNDFAFDETGARAAGALPEISSDPIGVYSFDLTNKFTPIVQREYFVLAGGEVQWYGNRLFFDSGVVLDPANLWYLGSFPSGSKDWDPALQRMFNLQGTTVQLLDPKSLLPTATLATPLGTQDNFGMWRWGVDGLAYLTSDRRLVMFESDLVSGTPHPRGVLSNDQDADGVSLGAAVVSNVKHGTLALNADGSFVYRPKPGFSGSDKFTYKVVDPAGESNVATVSIHVRPINHAPQAHDETYATSQVGQVQTTAARGVLANDSDREGDALTAALVQEPANGALVFNADGSFVYTPAAGFTGQDQFTYRASDGQLQSNVATVIIQVRSALVDVALRAVANPSASDTATSLPSSLAAVDVGSEYYVEIWVQDVGATPVGLPGGQLDLNFDAARSDALALGHGGLYNLIPTGAIDEAGGRIDDLGGGTINPAASNAPQWARLGFVRVLASADGMASYQLGPGALKFSRVGGGSVPWEQVDLSETLLVDHQAEAELEARVVSQPTAVDAAGEVDALPTSLPWVDEWSGYWVEIWVRSTDQGAGQGISQATANLLYDTRYGTAREIEYGPAFTSGRTGTIDDAAGRVTNLGAATTRSDVGDDRFALLARVRFAPGASDQAPLDEAGRFVGPYDLALGLEGPAVRLVGTATDGPTDLHAADLPIYAALYDIDDNDQIDYGDLSYFAAAFGKVDAGGGQPPYVWWANFDRQGAVVDFGDFSYLAANFGRTKEQGGLTYPANYPAVWTALAASSLGAQALDGPAKPLGGDAAAMNVQLVARATPGASDNVAALPAGLTQVALGGTYTLEVWVQDTKGIGVTGGLVDINYPRGRVDAVELEHGGVYTTFVNGTLRELQGRADDLGGGSVAAALGAQPRWVRLGYFSFEVTGAGPLEFQLAPGQLQFSRFGAGNVAWADVNLGSLTLNPALMGDLNSDHAVDLTDFGALKANFGQGTTWAQGDLDGNGRVDLGDFGRFKENFGRTAAALAAVLPPPPATPSAVSNRIQAAAIDRVFAAEEDSEDPMDWSFAFAGK